jgi:hypothetical protein
MATPKRKNFYREEFSKEFPQINRSKKGDDYAHCIPCDAEISLTTIGKTAIELHQKTDKHKRAVKAANTSRGIYRICAEYICANKFGPPNSSGGFPTHLDWISLTSNKVFHEEVMNLAEEIAPDVDDNQLYDEVSALNEILKKIPEEGMTAEKNG